MAQTNSEMVDEQLRRRDVVEESVLKAMESVDRALFVPHHQLPKAYDDSPLSIGDGQTISQPYIVGYMAQALQLKPDEILLEIGAGCGYNAAVLSRLVRQVYSIEIVENLVNLAKENLEKAGARNVSVRRGDGFEGWPEAAPFDAIMLTAAPRCIPQPLKGQLRIGGRLLAPVGKDLQTLKLWRKNADDSFEERDLLPVAFVPMTGAAQG